jgi:cell division transport system permease protein
LVAAARRASGVALGLAALLGGLALIGAAAADRGASDWVAEIGREATVVVRPRVDETGPAAAARAAEVLAGVSGVAEARALDRAEAERLLRPWVREGDLKALNLPMLVEVRLDSAAPAGTLTLNRALAEAGLDAETDDVGPWREEAARAATGVRALAAVLALAALGALGALAWARAGAATAGMRADIGVLRALGADPRRTTGLALAATLPMVVVACLAGAGAAAALAALWKLSTASGQAASALPVAWSHLALCLAAPAIGVPLATLSTARAVRETLGGRYGEG